MSSCHPVRSLLFYHRPIGAYPIHGSGSAAKGVGSGDGAGLFLCAVFLSSLSFAMSSGSPRRGRRLIVFVQRRGGLDGFLTISSGSSISLAQSPQSHHGWRRVSVILFKQATRLWHPSHHGASHLGSSSHPIISSHPHHEASRLSSRPMRLANHLERIPSPRHQRGKSDGEASKRTRKNGKAGTRNGEQDGVKNGTNTTRQRKERTGRGRTASKQGEGNGDIRRNHAQEQRLSSFSPDPLAVGSRRFIGLNQFPRPQGVG